MDNLVFRAGRVEDLPQLVLLEQDAFSEPWSEQSLSPLLEVEGSFLLVAEKNFQLVGYAAYTSVLEEGMIANLCVYSGERGNGIGRELFQRLIQHGETQGIRVFYLEVRISNEAAITLYEKEGFEVVGRRKNFYSKPTEDAWVYRKEVGAPENSGGGRE